MGVGLGGLGKSLVTRTTDLFDQVCSTFNQKFHVLLHVACQSRCRFACESVPTLCICNSTSDYEVAAAAVTAAGITAMRIFA